MAKVSYLDIPSYLEDIYKNKLQPGDRFQWSRVRVKDLFLSRARVKGVTIKSLLISLAPMWAAFDSTTKDAWTAAGAAMGLNGWKMFVNDTAARRRAGYIGFGTPNTIYQSTVGKLEVASPATSILIEQAHPSTYYVRKKVSGTRSQYSPKAVYEFFSLPLEISISYKTELTSAGASPRARFFCTVYSSYQGRDIETVVEVPFGLSDDWQRASASLTEVVGSVHGYSAFIEIFDAQGVLYFDDVALIHDGENWARDPDCSNISQTFTKAFYQVARAWLLYDPSDGMDYGSIYYEP